MTAVAVLQGAPECLSPVTPPPDSALTSPNRRQLLTPCWQHFAPSAIRAHIPQLPPFLGKFLVATATTAAAFQSSSWVWETLGCRRGNSSSGMCWLSHCHGNPSHRCHCPHGKCLMPSPGTSLLCSSNLGSPRWKILGWICPFCKTLITSTTANGASKAFGAFLPHLKDLQPQRCLSWQQAESTPKEMASGKACH